MKFTAAIVLALTAVSVDAQKSCQGQGVKGYVFEDTNGNSIFDDNEVGIADVMVSNGLEVVKTGSDGCYLLPVPTSEDNQAGISYFITKPDGYALPRNEDNVPQFFYIHKPFGSPDSVHGGPFRFGGLPPTGKRPARIDFPLIKTEEKTKFKIVTSGDPQAYSNDELGYFRDSIIKELIGMEDLEAIVIMGDVMGDDLSMFKRFRELVSLAGIPQYYVAGNHDLDFDAPSDADSFDTFRNEFGPEYYSFEIGQVHFIVMDDVKYPCDATDNLDGLHEFCVTRTDYNGVVTERQLQWLQNDLAHVPTDKLIFLQMHIPIHSFIDMNLVKHMVDNVVELYEALGCSRAEDGIFYAEGCARPVVSLGAHTHTNENIRAGEDFEGWRTALDSGSLPAGRSAGPPPFHQQIVGAASGTWWAGDFNMNKNPEGLQRLGAPKGYYIWEFDGSSYMETYKASELPADKQMSLDFSTPEFRDWFYALAEWFNENPEPKDLPPENINTLPDTKILTVGHINETYLTANIWNGSRDSIVRASFDGGDFMFMTRTNQGAGENILETLDPYALKREMQVTRYAFATSNEETRANGFELFRGSNLCSSEVTGCTPRPMSSWTWTDQSSHIWQVAVPSSLKIGKHTVTVETVDVYGRTYHETMAFEIAEERPYRFFRTDFFEDRP